MIWALHGNLGSRDDWNRLRHQLPQIEPVDLWASPPSPFDQWSHRLNDLVSATDPDPVLLGYSLGGRLAMHCATGLDSAWKAAVFVSAHPGLTSETEKAARLVKDRDWALKLRNDGVEAFLEAWNRQSVFSGDPIPKEQSRIVSQHQNAIAQAFETWSLGRQMDQRDLLRQTKIPQLWVVGEKDAKFRDLAESATLENPAAALKVIENCGHRVIHERPDALASLIREFLSGL
ncbi:MAG: alpha/beta fold hydrolase [Verrucomicrobiota bacterium]